MKADYVHMLKERNLSLTAVRLAVLGALDKHPHADAARIFSVVQKTIPTASLQAVYNNLNTLVEHGIIREIKPRGHLSLYETRTADNHHHVVCRACDRVMDTDCKGCAPCLSPADNHGFAVDEAEVIFWGLCPQCQKKNKNSKPKKEKAR